VCKERGVLFVVNGSQAIGARPIDLSSLPVDALVGCGFKWLCGPYATGYAWVRPSIVESLRNRPAYWLSQLDESGLGAEVRYEIRDNLGAAAFDVFCTANFLNFTAWEQSLSLVNALGVETIARYDDALVDRVIAGAKDAGFDVLSPEEGNARSTLVFVSHRDPSRNDAVHSSLREEGIHVAKRVGALRISPHFYNNEQDIDRLLDGLRRAS
ncbi:MAG: aminotransferase class V-fold PLP-dependent enzyme, partial [Actinomycetota bacterium]|nr:aminotransferase class V-fold PLP-dependent enzyme [Actinomycetota bacterium]